MCTSPKQELKYNVHIQRIRQQSQMQSTKSTSSTATGSDPTVLRFKQAHARTGRKSNYFVLSSYT